MPLLDVLGIALVLGLVLGALVWALAVANVAGTPASDEPDRLRDEVSGRPYQDPGTGEWIEP